MIVHKYYTEEAEEVLISIEAIEQIGTSGDSGDVTFRSGNNLKTTEPYEVLKAKYFQALTEQGYRNAAPNVNVAAIDEQLQKAYKRGYAQGIEDGANGWPPHKNEEQV